MAGSRDTDGHRWHERMIIAAMVVAGFALGSVGLTLAAELLGDDPILTDEFNAPVADDTTGVVTITVTSTTSQPPTTTTEPALSASGAPDANIDDDRRGRDDRDGPRPDRSDGRDARRRA